jgi:chemotaxis protein MotB
MAKTLNSSLRNESFKLDSNDDDDGNEQLWIVTFADSMSLLLTFFVLLISFSSTETVKVTESMKSVSEHLGGGARVGVTQTRTNFNISQEEDELAKQYLNLTLSDMPVPFQVDEKPIKLSLNKFQKVNAIQELLRENPALLSMLIQKKSLPPAKALEYDALNEKSVDDLDMRSAQLELSLQNLDHYVMAEGLDEVFSTKRNEHGEISFEIDCSALFEDDTAVIKYESRLLLVRIAKLLKTIPNKVAIQHFISRNLMYSSDLTDDLNIQLLRSQAIIEFLLDKEENLEADRFSILARGYEEKKWESIHTVNTSGDGVLGITILAYSEDMY